MLETQEILQPVLRTAFSLEWITSVPYSFFLWVINTGNSGAASIGICGNNIGLKNPWV